MRLGYYLQVCCLLLFISSAQVIVLHAQSYNFINFSLQEGLPQSQIFDLFKDSRGYLWVATNGGGIARFDGEEFVNYNTANGLLSGYVQAIHEDTDACLWVGTSKGLNHYNWQTGFSALPIDTTASFSVTSLHRGQDSTMWVGTKTGVYLYPSPYTQPQKLPLPKSISTTINGFLATPDGVWILTQMGAYLFDHKPPWAFKESLFPGQDVTSGEQVQAELLWFSIFGQGIYQLNNNRKINKVFDMPYLKRVQKLAVAPHHEVWVGTQDQGLIIYSFRDTTWNQVTESMGLPHHNVKDFQFESDAQMWIGTSGGGLARYSGQNFAHFHPGNGLPGTRVYALDQGPNGQLYLSVSIGRLTRVDSTGFSSFWPDSLLPPTQSKALYIENAHRLWVGTEGRGLLLIDSSKAILLSKNDGLPSNWIRSIAADGNGRIWIATHGNGLATIRPTDSTGYSITPVRVRGFQGNPTILQMQAGPDGDIWFSTRSGQVGHVVNGRNIKLYGPEDGLPKSPIRSFTFDTQGGLWLGTAGEGVYYGRPVKGNIVFLPVTAPQPFSSKNIYLLLFDPQGSLWVGSEIGVDKMAIDSLGGILSVQQFGRNEGFLGIETCRNAALQDKAGNLWFGTMNGLMKHTPSDRRRVIKPPEIHFQNIRLFYKPLQETAYKDWVLPKGGLRPDLRLPHHQNHLSFDFRAVQITQPADIEYTWKLEGAEFEWSPLSTKTAVNYSNLPPGKYTFRVKACYPEGPCSEAIQVNFEIEIPFWRRTDFLAGLSLIGFIALLGMFWYVILGIRKREKQKRSQLEIKNNLLQLEQKALQLQMNPHFIFNALNSIQALVATGEQQQARNQINQFASLMRMTLSNSRKKEISLEEELEGLKKYLEMEQFCQPTPFSFDIHCGEGMNPEEIELPPMLIQPFVENAIIHGLAHTKRPGKIQLSFSQNGGYLHCTLTDNGVGREKAERLKQSKKPGHQSIAMQVTRERLENLPRNQNQAPLFIEDIMDATGQVVGTRVQIIIPIETF